MDASPPVDGEPAPGLPEPATGGPRPTMLADAIGGVRGVIDSGAPALVFVLVNAVVSLRAAIIVAVGAGLFICIARLIRREPMQQAIYGFLGVALAAYLAHRTGSARAFFLPGILLNALYGAAGLVSIVVGYPIGGYAFAAFDERYARWRQQPATRRVAVQVTLAWTAVFALRVLVQGLLYLQGSPGWLAVAKIAMGWPLAALAAGLTLQLLRRLPDEIAELAARDADPGGSGSAVGVEHDAAAEGAAEQRGQLLLNLASGGNGEDLIAGFERAVGAGNEHPTLPEDGDEGAVRR